MLRADTHFHTNFAFISKRLIERRAKKFWEQFKKYDLDVVVLTEHAFKSPASSYKYLMKHRPDNATTHVVPGVEAVTKEGIDVIVFSKDEHIYEQKDVLTPYGLTVRELADRVKEDDRLHAVVTHPFMMSDTAITLHYKEDYIKDLAKELGILEKHNAALVPLRSFLSKIKANKLLGPVYKRMERIEDAPNEFVEGDVCIFGGSDAHYPRDIGPHVKIHAEGNTFDEIFERLVDPSHKREFDSESDHLSLVPYVILNGLTTLFETIKKRTRLFYLTTVDSTFKKPKNKISYEK
jgi:hypothetical protein